MEGGGCMGVEFGEEMNVGRFGMAIGGGGDEWKGVLMRRRKGGGGRGGGGGRSCRDGG